MLQRFVTLQETCTLLRLATKSCLGMHSHTERVVAIVKRHKLRLEENIAINKEIYRARLHAPKTIYQKVLVSTHCVRPRNKNPMVMFQTHIRYRGQQSLYLIL